MNQTDFRLRLGALTDLESAFGLIPLITEAGADDPAYYLLE